MESRDQITDVEEAASDPDAPRSRREWLWSEFKFFAKLGAFILAFITLVWGHFKIPSESMQPTLEVGDHLYVSKYAYGYSKHSLPYLLHNLPLPEGRIFSRLPKRGDVVVFRNPKTGIIMIKRVVGLPGDTLQVRRGQLYLNGERIERERIDGRLYREHATQRVRSVNVYNQTLPGMDEGFVIYERDDSHPLDNTPVFIVPEDSVFFMGDNRDNSIDSRAPRNGPGIVPMDYIMGRADRVMFSFKRCDRTEDLYCPAKGRVMKKL
ncbi:MAG: signal peptidase I [Litorimonas sp.]